MTLGEQKVNVLGEYPVLLCEMNRCNLVDYIYKLENRIKQLEDTQSLGWGEWKFKDSESKVYSKKER